MSIEQIQIDQRIKQLRHILVYGDGRDLLYRIIDTDRIKDIKVEKAYAILLQKARDILAMAKVNGWQMNDQSTIHTFHFFIVERQAIHVAVTFALKEREIVEPPKACAYQVLRCQIGRNWN